MAKINKGIKYDTYLSNPVPPATFPCFRTPLSPGQTKWETLFLPLFHHAGLTWAAETGVGLVHLVGWLAALFLWAGTQQIMGNGGGGWVTWFAVYPTKNRLYKIFFCHSPFPLQSWWIKIFICLKKSGFDFVGIAVVVEGLRDQASRDREGGEGKLRRRHQRRENPHLLLLRDATPFSFWREVHKIDGKLTRENSVCGKSSPRCFFPDWTINWTLQQARVSSFFFRLSRALLAFFPE